MSDGPVSKLLLQIYGSLTVLFTDIGNVPDTCIQYRSDPRYTILSKNL